MGNEVGNEVVNGNEVGNEVALNTLLDSGESLSSGLAHSVLTFTLKRNKQTKKKATITEAAPVRWSGCPVTTAPSAWKCVDKSIVADYLKFSFNLSFYFHLRITLKARIKIQVDLLCCSSLTQQSLLRFEILLHPLNYS